MFIVLHCIRSDPRKHCALDRFEANRRIHCARDSGRACLDCAVPSLYGPRCQV